MSDTHDREAEDRPEQHESVDQARRALLKLSLYVPPAVIGSMLISKTALAQTPSCSPVTCTPNACTPQPCGPSTNPCEPGSSCEPDPPPCTPTSCPPMVGKK